MENLGNDSARNLWKFGKVYVESSDIAVAQKAIVPDFEKSWIAFKKTAKPGKIMNPGDPQFTSMVWKGFTPQQVKDIYSGSSQIYIPFRV